MLEGWVAPPPDPQPEGAGWLGEALAATTPLSPADLQTLAAVGVDVNDGVGAFRLLATLLRVLERRQAVDLGELAAEVHASRSEAEAAAGEARGDAHAGALPHEGAADEHAAHEGASDDAPPGGTADEGATDENPPGPHL